MLQINAGFSQLRLKTYFVPNYTCPHKNILWKKQNPYSPSIQKIPHNRHKNKHLKRTNNSQINHEKSTTPNATKSPKYIS